MCYYYSSEQNSFLLLNVLLVQVRSGPSSVSIDFRSLPFLRSVLDDDLKACARHVDVKRLTELFDRELV